MSPSDKPLVWLAGEVRTPPFSPEARIEAGFLLRKLQQDESLSMPHSRPVPSIGRRCHELEVFAKKTQTTPKKVIETCRARLAMYRDSRR